MTKPSAGNSVALTGEEKSMEFTPYGSDSSIRLSVGIIKTLICIKTKSGKVCNDNDAIKFMMMCQARKLNPFEGDAFLQGYDSNDGPVFSLITAHQAFLKRAELHPEYDGMESGVIVRDKQTGAISDREGDFTFEEDVLLGAWATVFFKKRSHPTKRRLKLETFRKGYGRWKDDPAGMIVKCAEADALRSSFPTMLGGLYMRDEIEPITEEERFRAAKPIPSPAPAALPAPTSRAVAAPTPAPPASNVSAPTPAATKVDPPQPSAPQSPDPDPGTGASAGGPPNDETPVGILRRNIAEANLTEANVVQWASNKWRLRDCSTLDHILEVSPRKINDLINNWGAYSDEIINSLN